jgi:HEAT repeat protein
MRSYDPPHLKLMRKVTTVRRTRWISRLLLAGVAAAPPAVTFAADDSGGDVARLQAQLINASTAPSDRDEAARRLIARDGADAHKQVLADLQNDDTAARTALANAIATATDPDPSLIPALAKLLGGKGDLTRAAAASMVNYPDHPEVPELLGKFATDPTKSAAQRAVVVGVMGSLVDQGLAKLLVGRLQDAQESSEVRRAADEALGIMTGLNFGTNSNAWVQWWTGSASGWTADHFAAEVLKTREKNTAQLQSRYSRLNKESTALLQRDYLDIRANQPAIADATLLSYLNSASPEIRNLGASQDFVNVPPSEKIKSRLREMIGDSDDAVRRKVVDVVLAINDRPAITALLNQLSVERVPGIKMAIVSALGKIEDPAAITTLLKLVHGSQMDIATAAAKEIAGPLGEKLHTDDPVTAAKISQDLRGMINSIANIPADDDLRAACMRALSTLRDRQSQSTFNHFLQPGETVAVQCAAIEGIGNLGDSKNEDMIDGQLESPNRDIRLAAAQALTSVSTPGGANALYNKLDTENDPAVKRAIWKACVGLFDRQSETDLQDRSTRLSNDIPRHLEILLALADKETKSRHLDDLASTNQGIADAYMKLDPPKPLQAIESLQKAIDYWELTNPDDNHLDQALSQMLQCYFKARKYASAVTFATTQISKHKAYEPTVVGPLKDEADRLITDPNATAEDIDNAKTIVTGCLAIPNLGANYPGQFQAMLQDIQKRTTAPTPPVSH